MPFRRATSHPRAAMTDLGFPTIDLPHTTTDQRGPYIDQRVTLIARRAALIDARARKIGIRDSGFGIRAGAGSAARVCDRPRLRRITNAECRSASHECRYVFNHCRITHATSHAFSPFAAEPHAMVARGASLWSALKTPSTPAGVRDATIATPSPASAEAALGRARSQTLSASGNVRPLLRSESPAAHTTDAAPHSGQHAPAANPRVS